MDLSIENQRPRDNSSTIKLFSTKPKTQFTSTAIMSQPDMTHHFTHLAHTQSYPAISSSSPSLSTCGKTILITGGSQGIGLAIATAFAVAGAAHIIVVGRNPGTLAEAQKSLQSTHTAANIHTFTTEVSDARAVKALFATIRADIADPDILVLNAAHAGMPGPTLDYSAESLASDLEVNVIGNMSFITEYLRKDTLTKPKVVLNVSTAATNQVIPNLASYGASKLAFLYMCMHLQNELHGKNVRIMNFHPGAIFTTAAKNVGMTAESIAWDKPDLPGNFAVWLASKEAAFLAGRLVYATWDVEELKSRAGEIVDKDLLKIGLRGDAAKVTWEERAQLNGASEQLSSAFAQK
jgi:NADP-dependent 3-hydroxy acid dehydrogenase YdfG